MSADYDTCIELAAMAAVARDDLYFACAMEAIRIRGGFVGDQVIGSVARAVMSDIVSQVGALLEAELVPQLAAVLPPGAGDVIDAEVARIVRNATAAIEGMFPVIN